MQYVLRLPARPEDATDDFQYRPTNTGDQYGRPMRADQYGRPMRAPSTGDQYGRPIRATNTGDQYGRRIPGDEYWPTNTGDQYRPTNTGRTATDYAELSPPVVQPCRYATLAPGCPGFFEQGDSCLRTDGYFHAPLRPNAQVDRANQPLDAARAEYRGLALSDFSGHCERVDAGQAAMTGCAECRLASEVSQDDKT